jgi:arabinofuranan 3-O-arabinosyltransferase
MTTTYRTPPRISDPEQVAYERASVERLRLSVIMLGLTLAVFGQSAGNTATDTKFDLVISPLRFLGRALRLWDPIGNAGQLQNQAYGYLFPMGPFFAVLHAVGFQPWEIQRAWESAVICAAFLGSYLLARRMGVDRFWPAVGTGMVYALAPRMLSELTTISSELMPVAALPWMILPLVGAVEQGSPRRAAARSGLAVLFAGGVNAAATLAVLPAPALFLLLRTRGRRQWALIRWWMLAVLLATLWWTVPLLTLGRYSPAFLDWIESSSTTTLPTSLLATLRGVEHWEQYLGPSIWPAGWILASAPVAILATTLVAAAGLIGLARRDTTHHAFLWATLLLGLVCVTAGHAATVGPPAADWVRSLLDGAFVPFRNVHKFDPLVRLPLAIGIGHLLLRARVPRQLRVARIVLPLRILAAAAVVAVGLVAASPVFTNHLVSSQRVTAEPSWWANTAKWLAAHSEGARALVVPGSASPQYLWGGTVDNALQPVATTPWTVRDSVPLAQPGYVRLLNAIEAKLAAGAADAQLAPLLARAGIGYVVLANDLNTLTSASTPLLYVRTTLDNSPGLSLRASIGPKVGGTLSETAVLDSGATVAQPAVQIYGVHGWAGKAQLQPLTGAVEATGSSDSLPQLVARGLSADTPVLFGSDASAVPVPDPLVVTTDGIRRQQASFAGLLAPSVTMTANAPYTSDRPVHDYLPDKHGPLSALRYLGVAGITASSSGADPLAYLNRGDQNGPWSALDDDPRTAWFSSSFAGAVGQWLRVELNEPIDRPAVRVAFAAVPGSALPSAVRVETEAGTVVDHLQATTAAQPIAVPPGSTRTLRITVTQMADRTRGGSVAISALSIGGVSPARTLQVPSAAAPELFAFDAASGYRGTCLDVAGRAICDPHYARQGQEDSAIDRSFEVPGGATAEYVPTASVRLVGSAELDRLLDAGTALQASASSTNSTDPRQRAGAAVDGNPATSWQAAPGDAKPSLTVQLPAAQSLTGLTLMVQGAAVARPVAATVVAGGLSWHGSVPADGHIVFDRPVRADRVVITITGGDLRPTTDTPGLTTRLEPVGVAEVVFDGMPIRAPAAGAITLGCDAGLTMSVDGESIPMTATASRQQALTGAVVPARACADSTVAIGQGAHRVSLDATAGAMPVSVTLTRVGGGMSSAPAPGRMSIRSWHATERQVDVDTRAPALLVVHENWNAGWRATLNGHRLQAVQADGWEQAFVVPAGSHGTVRLDYGPQRLFVAGLIAGAAAVLALLALAFGPPGRDDYPPTRPPRTKRRLALVACVGAFALLGGWAGALTFAVLAVAAVLAGRIAAVAVRTFGGALLVVAALVVARGERTLIFVRQNGSTAQLLCVAALAIAVLAALGLPRQGRDP